MQVQLVGLLVISSVGEITVLYVHPALLVIEDVSAQNLLDQTLQTKSVSWPKENAFVVKKPLKLLKIALPFIHVQECP